MATALTDMTLYGDLFGTDAMRSIFDESACVARMIAVERALVDALEETRLIDRSAADTARSALNSTPPSPADLAADTARIGRPVKPLVDWFRDRGGPAVHTGATTQDIMDTALVLQMQAGTARLLVGLKPVIEALARLVETHADTPMAGRTIGQHAEPITFGFMAATWVDELLRARAALTDAALAANIVQLGGAVGTLAAYGDGGAAMRAALARRLGLAEPAIAWHTARDRIAAHLFSVQRLTAALGRMATDLYRLAASDVAELREAAPGASSAMAHKRNPLASETIMAIARLSAASAPAVIGALDQEAQRFGPSLTLERKTAPDLFVLASGAVHQAAKLLDGLIIDSDQMVQNLSALPLPRPLEVDIAAAAGQARAFLQSARESGQI